MWNEDLSEEMRARFSRWQARIGWWLRRAVCYALGHKESVFREYTSKYGKGTWHWLECPSCGTVLHGYAVPTLVLVEESIRTAYSPDFLRGFMEEETPFRKALRKKG